MSFVRRYPLVILLGAMPMSAHAAPDPKLFEYEPNPAIWKLSDADTTIYMFGTIHTLPEKLKWQSPALKKVIGEVDELVLETVDGPGTEFFNDKMTAEMIGRLDQKPLVDRVKPENREWLKILAREARLSLDYLDMLPTWQVSFAFSYAFSEQNGVSQDYGVETVLEKQFKDSKRPVSGIEDRDQVDASLSGLSDADQMIALDGMLTDIRLANQGSLVPADNPVDPDAENLADDVAWAKGDLSGIGKDLQPDTMGPAYYKALLVDRNTAWTEWLQKRLDRPGSMLLAVGAGHLSGIDSVQEQLKAKGLTVERIQ